MNKDLFGKEHALTPAERRKVHPKRSEPVPSGHIRPPGTGPHGETCRGCAHSVARSGVSGSYWKCALNRAIWTGGRKTDIRLRDAACEKWERKK